MFKLSGNIKFDPINVTKKHNKQSSWKKTAIIEFNNDDIYKYYAWFIKKRFNISLNKPLRGTHVTIINEIVDDDVYLNAKNIFDRKDITIEYDPTIIEANRKGHWWIKAYCDDIKNIRKYMGLNPDPFFKLHLTIGLATHLQLEHSNYILDQCLKFNI
jgi:hypothetical protein